MKARNSLLFGLSLLTCTSLFADLKIDVYGYAKLDMQYNDRNTGSFPSPGPNAVPLDTDRAAKHGELIVDARESRLGVKATDQFNNIDLTGLVEGDFFTADGNALTSNSRGFRLRHAYGKAELPSGFFLLAGQFWTLFLDETIAQPNLIDFNGPAGQVTGREPQLRLGYKKHFDETWGDVLLQGSLEKHSFNTLGIVNPDNLTDTAQGSGQNFPMGVVKFQWISKYFACSLAGAGAQSCVVTNLSGHQVKKAVWAAEGSLQFNYKKLSLFAHAHHLNGLSRLEGENFVDLALTASNQLKPVKSNGCYAGASWSFTEDTSFNTVYGWEKAYKIPNTSFDIGSSDLHKIWSFHANILHTFWKRFQTGIEYERLNVRTLSGTPGHVNMYHTAFYYYF